MMTVAALPMNTGAEPSISQTFFEEDVEQPTFEEWNVRWEKSDADPDSSLDTWCRTMHEYYTGGHSAYCARQGYNTHYSNSSGYRPMNHNLLSMPTGTPPSEFVQRYDTDMDAIMRRAVSGLAGYETIALSFWMYSDTGLSNARQPGSGALVGYDFLNVIYYTGASSQVKQVAWTDSWVEASARTWMHFSVEIPNTATWVGFEFVSGSGVPQGGDPSDAFAEYGVRTDPLGSTGMKEGVYLDDISLIGTGPVSSFLLHTSVESLDTYQNSSSFPVNYVDNDPVVPLEWTYLYYRVNETGNWIKYTTVERTAGTFVSSPIMFQARGDGTYEFFTQGKNSDDVMEPMKDVADAYTIVDTRPPVTTATIIGTERTGGYNGAVAVELTSVDATSGVDTVQYRVDGGEWGSHVDSVIVSDGGTHIIEYYANDLAGNIEGMRSITFEVTEGKPGVVFRDPDRTYPKGDVTIAFTVADSAAVKKLEYSLDGADFVEMDVDANTISLDGIVEGYHNLTIRSTDLSDQTSTDGVNFTVSSDLDPLDALTGEPLLLGGLVVGAVAVIGGGAYFMRRRM